MALAQNAYNAVEGRLRRLQEQLASKDHGCKELEEELRNKRMTVERVRVQVSKENCRHAVRGASASAALWPHATHCHS